MAEALFTGMNEYSEIFAQFFTQDTTMDEIRQPLIADRESRTALGCPSLKLVTVDNCCTAATMLKEIYPALSADLKHMVALPVPSDRVFCCSINTKNDVYIVNNFLKPFLDHMNHSQSPFLIGWDAEWDTKDFKKVGRACVMQLAFSEPYGKKYCLFLWCFFNFSVAEQIFVVQFTKTFKKELFPQNLRSILQSEKSLKIGNYVNWEVKYAAEDWGVTVDINQCVQLQQLIKRKGYTRRGNLNLDLATRLVLGFSCPKDTTEIDEDGVHSSVRTSLWSSSLSKEKVEYAARDAYASLRIYQEAAKRDDSFVTYDEDLVSPFLLSAAASVTSPQHDTDMVAADRPETPISGSLHTRVLLDVFHGMMRIGEHISKGHKFHFAFTQHFRDAMFEIDAGDRASVEAALRHRAVPTTFDRELEKNPKWVWERVRRRVPEPDILEKRLQLLLEEMSQSRYNDGSTPLLSEKAKKEIANLLVHVRKGCLSDPPGVSMYYFWKVDKEGLKIFRCIRGTNHLESFHQKLEMIFDAWNASPHYADCAIAVIRHRTNISASERNRPNFPILGFSDQYLVDEIQWDGEAVTGKRLIKWWPKCYIKSKSSLNFGFVSTLPAEKRVKVTDEDVKSYKPLYAFLAKAQQSLIPFLPIITKVEREMFFRNVAAYLGNDNALKMSSASYFRSNDMAKDWNSGQMQHSLNNFPSVAKGVLKKNPGHLRSFFKVTYLIFKCFDFLTSFVEILGLA